jgi:hypothetical protein
MSVKECIEGGEHDGVLWCFSHNQPYVTCDGEEHGGHGMSAEDARLAEEWLTAHHSFEWYIGDATAAEWKAAYAAVEKLCTTVADDRRNPDGEDTA